MARGSLQSKVLNRVPSVPKLLELISCELLRVKIVSIINSFARSVLSASFHIVVILWLPHAATLPPLFSLPPLSSSLMISVPARKSLLPGFQLLQIPQQAATSVELQPKLVLQVSCEGEGEGGGEREGDSKLTCARILDFLSKLNNRFVLHFFFRRSPKVSGLSLKSLLGYCACHQGVPPPLFLFHPLFF